MVNCMNAFVSQQRMASFIGDAGLVNDVSFYLSIKLPIDRMPRNGDGCIFHDVKYKVDHVDVDSAHTSITVYLQSLSKG